MGNYGWFFEQWQGKMGKHYVDNNNGRGADPATKVVFDESGGAEAVFTVTNTAVAATDVPILAIASGGTTGDYGLSVTAVAAGVFD